MFIPQVKVTLPDAGIVRATVTGWFSGKSFRISSGSRAYASALGAHCWLPKSCNLISVVVDNGSRAPFRSDSTSEACRTSLVLLTPCGG